jgi:phosphoribosylformimino-5-aminoimidazole carboxamide ribotide isomerase
MITIIPAIDLIDGKCVRLSQGDYAAKKVYHDHPADVAKEFEQLGIARLHLVDLDGAKAGAVMNLRVLEDIAKHTHLKIDFGGGVANAGTARQVVNAGAQWISVGSIAVKNPGALKEWMSEIGPERFMIGADVRDRKLAISGWLEQTDIDIMDFIQQWSEVGVRQFFCTDIAKDGLLQGPSLDLYRDLLQRHPAIEVIASGGVASMHDIDRLEELGCHGVIVGKAIYEGKITKDQLKQRIA